QTHHGGLGGVVAQHLQGALDPVGNRIAGRDAAEHIDKHALDLGVAENHVEAVRHDLGGRAASDVKEICRFDAGVCFAGIGDDVEGAHDESGPVADDADLPV